MANDTPMTRSLAALEAEGYAVERLRRWDRKRRRRHRPFAFADLLALKPGAPPLAVFLSAAATDRLHGDRALLAALPEVGAWLAGGNELQVWAFLKRRGRFELLRLPVGPGE